MPVRGIPAQLFDLGFQLGYPILAAIAQPGRNGRTHGGCGMPLGDGNDAHGMLVPGALTGPLDALQSFADAFRIRKDKDKPDA